MTKQTLTLDSTQIDSFLTCPRQWFFGHVLRKTPIMGPPSTALCMGTYGHKLMEIYYKSLSAGKTQGPAIEEALAFSPESETLCLHCKKHKGFHTQGIGYCFESEISTRYEGSPFPLSSDDRKLVQKRFREYSYTYSRNDIVPYSPEHVEVGFSHNLYEDDNYLFILEGKIDVLGEIQGQKVVLDHKFQMRKHDLYQKAIQFKNYALASDARMFIINYVRLNKEIGEDTYRRYPIGFTKPELDQWRIYLIAVYKKIAEAIKMYEKNGFNYWLTSDSDPRWSSCSGKFGYHCDFTPICEEPGLAESKLTNLYHIKEEWKPW